MTMAGLGRDIVLLYEKRRDKAVLAQERRRSEAFAKNPALLELDAEIGALGVRNARSILHEGSEGPAELDEQLGNLKIRRSALLAETGFPENWLDAWWTCGMCRDTGYVDSKDGSGRTPCICTAQLVLDRLYRASNLARDAQIGFDRYTDKYYADNANKDRHSAEEPVRAHMNAVYDRIRHFAGHFEEEGTRSLYLYGTTGTGKTFLAKSAGMYLLDSGHTVLYLSAPAFFDAARSAKFHDEDRPGAEDAYRRILDANLLILDDLGTEPATDSRYSDLLTLLEARSAPSAETRRTIIVSNMDLKRLYSVYNERIGSRISGEYEVLSFTGVDIRVMKRFG
jgi:DNA replication protein DnaC